MKKLFPIIMVVSLVTSVWADNYKILQMNTKTIKIGSRIYKKGDVFSEDSTINWSNDKQALKAQNTETKKVQLFVADAFQKKQSKSIKDYYIKNNRLSARAFGLGEMVEILAETFYLLDTIRIESPVPVDNTRYFYITFQDDGKDVRKSLPMLDDELLIDRSMFPRANKILETRVSMSYTCEGVDEDYLLTDSMRIIFVPKKIKHE